MPTESTHTQLDRAHHEQVIACADDMRGSVNNDSLVDTLTRCNSAQHAAHSMQPTAANLCRRGEMAARTLGAVLRCPFRPGPMLERDMCCLVLGTDRAVVLQAQRTQQEDRRTPPAGTGGSGGQLSGLVATLATATLFTTPAVAAAAAAAREQEAGWPGTAPSRVPASAGLATWRDGCGGAHQQDRLGGGGPVEWGGRRRGGGIGWNRRWGENTSPSIGSGWLSGVQRLDPRMSWEPWGEHRDYRTTGSPRVRGAESLTADAVLADPVRQSAHHTTGRGAGGSGSGAGHEAAAVRAARRRLQDAPGDVAEESEETEVRTAEELRRAVERGRPRIVVLEHMDLASLAPLRRLSEDWALGFAPTTVHSIRVRCLR